MPFCNNCGNEVTETQDVCLNCGAAVRKQPQGMPDNGGFGWGLLGFCVPLAGLVLYLVWKDEKPITAKAVGKGALISVIVTVSFYVLYFIIIIGLLASTGGM